jgi:hypothetical protein
VLSGLTILGDTSLKLTCATSNNENGTVSLRGTRNHVLDEITMTWSIDDLRHNQIEQVGINLGAERTVTTNLGVSNFQRAISIVIPRSRSAFSLSSTHAIRYEKFASNDNRRRRLTIFEGALAKLSSFLLELFDGTLIDTTALVD